MKKPIIAVLAAAALVTGCQTDSDMDMAGTRFQELPASIQETARTQIGDAQIVDVDQERRTGSTVYEITYAGADNNREKLHIREDGSVLSKDESSLLSDDEITEAAGAEAEVKVDAIAPRAEIETRTSGAAVEVDSNISTPEVRVNADANGPAIGTKLEDLPAAVQTTIKEKAAGAKIADIDKEERTGQVIYEVSFADEGLNPKIHVAADGRLVGEEEAELFHNEAAGAETTDRIEAKREVRGGAESLKEGAPATTEAELDADVDADLDVKDAEADVDVDVDVDDK